MKRAILVLAAFVVGLMSLPALAEEAPSGKSVYRTKTCMACHGPRGQRPVLTYPMLAGQTERYMFNQMRDIASGERVSSIDPETGHPYTQGMTDIMHLVNEDEMKAVAEYLNEQEPKAPKPAAEPILPENIEAGEAAFKRFSCRACHGKEGLKATNKNYPVIAGLNRDYLYRQMIDIRDKIRTNSKTKLMFGTIKRVDDATIGQIADYLSQVDRLAQ